MASATEMSDYMNLPEFDLGYDVDAPFTIPSQFPDLNFDDLDPMPTGMIDPCMGDTPVQTISPRDLHQDFNSVPGSSAPSSSTLTNWSTPSFSASGIMSANTSPMFNSDNVDSEESANWPPLITEDLNAHLLALKTHMDRVNNEIHIPQASAAMPVVPPPTSNATQAVPPPVSPGITPSPAGRSMNSPLGGSPKYSRDAITKHANGRKRKELPKIVVDPSKPHDEKRARNTEAARKSRERKVQRVNALEEQVNSLQAALNQAEQNAQYWKQMYESVAQ
ncbi:hypothetical protein BJX99DRAFT_254295 [Aspergillus californicus]